MKDVNQLKLITWQVDNYLFSPFPLARFALFKRKPTPVWANEDNEVTCFGQIYVMFWSKYSRFVSQKKSSFICFRFFMETLPWVFFKLSRLVNVLKTRSQIDVMETKVTFFYS